MFNNFSLIYVWSQHYNFNNVIYIKSLFILLSRSKLISNTSFVYIHSSEEIGKYEYKSWLHSFSELVCTAALLNGPFYSFWFIICHHPQYGKRRSRWLVKGFQLSNGFNGLSRGMFFKALFKGDSRWDCLPSRITSRRQSSYQIDLDEIWTRVI